ncbi:MAG TPA: DUF1697 domain-containing protein [Puia sp.]|jgi:uncharacterized protein (DUF1697 family)|nr:DUF1697 domain-containing protein [Puia sp.]
MTTYISILRGINVSGHKIIKMEALKQMYDSLGFKNVRTYIQSGNVIFQYKTTQTQNLANKIYKKVIEQFTFEVPVIVMEKEELKNIVDNNPFVGDQSKDTAYLHVTFLSGLPAKIHVEMLKAGHYTTEDFSISGKAIYLYCPNGYGNAKLNNNFLESRLKVTATTRNFKTTMELLSMAEQLAT